MIIVHLNATGFSYDVHSLVKAFYAKEDVKVNPDEGSSPAGEDAAQGISLVIAVVVRTEAISLSAWIPQPGAVSGGMDGVTQIYEGEDTCGSGIYAEHLLWEREESSEEGESRHETKNHLKAMLYTMLCHLTGRTLPWGNLTGIRPVKIPMAQLEAGEDAEDIAKSMRERYFVSEKKARLATQIAQRERRILKEIPYRNGYSLYVGIPFCPSICLYCSFSSSPVGVWKDRVEEYLTALMHEIRETAPLFAEKELCSVYMGGGTPTTLEPDQMDRLLTCMEQYFPVRAAREFTVEAGRPDSITREKLQVLRDHHISRISVNPQTMNQKTLDLIGRKHTVHQTEEAFYLAREMGFDNINMDLIVGLPGEGREEVADTMERIAALRPENVTVHSLALKRATRMHLMKDVYEDVSFQTSDEVMDLTRQGCEAIGLAPYYLYRQKNMAGNFENTGYAAPGKEGLYNILIMEEVQSILALGAGASTKFVLSPERIERVENVKDIRQYLERVDEMIERKKCCIGHPETWGRAGRSAVGSGS